MEEIRVDNLLKNKIYLSEDLLKKIDSFKYYVGLDKPLLVGLCASQKYAVKFSNVINDDKYLMNIHTWTEDGDEIYDSILFSDAVVIYTNTLKIAPETLMKYIEFASNYKKQIYVILGGWNQISKTEESIAKKIIEAQTSFSQVEVKNIYLESNQNKNSSFQTLTDIAMHIWIDSVANLSFMRFKQEETIYAFLDRSVKGNIADVKKEILREIVVCNNVLEVVLKKQRSGKIVFRNAVIDIKDVALHYSNEIIKNVPRDYRYYLENEQEELGVRELEDKVKTLIITNLDNIEDGEIDWSSNDVKLKLERLINESVRELLAIVPNLQELKYVSDDLLKQLTHIIKEKEDLEAFINEESNVYLTSLYESKNQVREAIQGIEIEHKAYDRVGMVREVFQWVDSGIEYYKQKTKDEKVSVPNNKETNESDETSQDYNWIESEENSESNRVEKRLRGLQNDQLNQAIDELCQRAYEIVFVKLDAKFSDINAIIQSIAVNYVDKYYSQIIALLEEVKLQLDKKANECKRV